MYEYENMISIYIHGEKRDSRLTSYDLIKDREIFVNQLRPQPELIQRLNEHFKHIVFRNFQLYKHFMNQLTNVEYLELDLFQGYGFESDYGKELKEHIIQFIHSCPKLRVLILGCIHTRYVDLNEDSEEEYDEDNGFIDMYEDHKNEHDWDSIIQQINIPLDLLYIKENIKVSEKTLDIFQSSNIAQIIDHNVYRKLSVLLDLRTHHGPEIYDKIIDHRDLNEMKDDEKFINFQKLLSKTKSACKR